MWHHDMTITCRMLEFAVAAFLVDLHPTLGQQSLDQGIAIHGVYHTHYGGRCQCPARFSAPRGLRRRQACRSGGDALPLQDRKVL
jgi:hypothetical protein